MLFSDCRTHLCRTHRAPCSALGVQIGPEAFVRVVLECVYACGATNELDLAATIHDRLLRDSTTAVVRDLGELEKILVAARKIAKCGSDSRASTRLSTHRSYFFSNLMLVLMMISLLS